MKSSVRIAEIFRSLIVGGWPEVSLIGGYPPPYGGVSVHLLRLATYLREHGCDFVLFNTLSSVEERPFVRSVARLKELWLPVFCAMHCSEVVHSHVGNWYGQLLYAVTAALRRGRYVITLHNMELNDHIDEGGAIRSLLSKWILRQMDVVIAVNNEIARACVTKAGVPADRVFVIPAFIPPPMEGLPALPQEVDEFAASHEPLLLGLVWKAGDRYRGADLYGVDMMIELMGRVKESRPKAGLVIIVLSGETSRKDRIAAEALQRCGESVLVLKEPIDSYLRLLRRCDLFLRPTNTDGDANSIREALFLGVPVVASDAVPRPDGSVLFKSRDTDDLEEKVGHVLDRRHDALQRGETIDANTINNAERILDLYRELTKA